MEEFLLYSFEMMIKQSQIGSLRCEAYQESYSSLKKKSYVDGLCYNNYCPQVKK